MRALFKRRAISPGTRRSDGRHHAPGIAIQQAIASDDAGDEGLRLDKLGSWTASGLVAVAGRNGTLLRCPEQYWIPVTTFPCLSVLFVSRANCVRSILAEACLANLSGGRFKAFSCGLPGESGRPIPGEVFEVLAATGLVQTKLRSKSWADFTEIGKPRMDIVIALDKNTVGGHPIWPGQPDTALWAIPPLASAWRDEFQAKAEVLQTLYWLRRRLEIFVALPMHGVDTTERRGDIRDIAYR